MFWHAREELAKISTSLLLMYLKKIDRSLTKDISRQADYNVIESERKTSRWTVEKGLRFFSARQNSALVEKEMGKKIVVEDGSYELTATEVTLDSRSVATVEQSLSCICNAARQLRIYMCMAIVEWHWKRNPDRALRLWRHLKQFRRPSLKDRSDHSYGTPKIVGAI